MIAIVPGTGAIRQNWTLAGIAAARIRALAPDDADVCEDCPHFVSDGCGCTHACRRRGSAE